MIRHPRGGFTLVEIMIVVLILAVLVVIGYPCTWTRSANPAARRPSARCNG